MSQQSQKSRKIRAIAAGGAVLGVGAAITLAAWSDSEFAEGIFNSGTFGIQAATDGVTWTDNADESSPLTIPFDVESMVPGQTVSAPYQISNVTGGEDSLVTFTQQSIAGDLADHLSVAIYQVDSVDCEATTGEEPVLDLVENNSFRLNGEDIEHLCIQVTLSGDFATPEQTGGNIAWEFQAEHAV